MPAVATAVSTAAQSVVCGPLWMPTLKLPVWNPLAISATAVNAGTTSLKIVIAVLERANTFTLQKFSKKYTITKAAAIASPGGVSSPRPPGAGTYSACVHAHGHEAMYCTEASASTGITETIAIQFDHAAMKPT